MTIRLQTQPDVFADRVLRLFGKRRAYVLPVEDERRFGSFSYAITTKESFWSALIRSKDAPLPKGLISKQQMEDLINGEEQLCTDPR